MSQEKSVIEIYNDILEDFQNQPKIGNQIIFWIERIYKLIRDELRSVDNNQENLFNANLIVETFAILKMALLTDDKNKRKHILRFSYDIYKLTEKCFVYNYLKGGWDQMADELTLKIESLKI